MRHTNNNLYYHKTDVHIMTVLLIITFLCFGFLIGVKVEESATNNKKTYINENELIDILQNKDVSIQLSIEN